LIRFVDVGAGAVVEEESASDRRCRCRLYFAMVRVGKSCEVIDSYI
jgi:hypothetical protein